MLRNLTSERYFSKKNARKKTTNLIGRTQNEQSGRIHIRPLCSLISLFWFDEVFWLLHLLILALHQH